MYVAEGKAGFRAYDVASIGNKRISQKIITAPFSAIRDDTHVGQERHLHGAADSTSIAPMRSET